MTFNRRRDVFGFRAFVAAVCLAQLAGCREESATSPDQTPAASSAPVASSAPNASSAPAGVVTNTVLPTLATVPANVEATAGATSISLSWANSSGATAYDVKRSTISGGPYTQIATTTSPTYTDATVSGNVLYYFVVSAGNAAGESANSAEVSADLVPPAATPVLTSMSITPSNTFAVVSGTQQFAATALDQNAKALNPQPSISWTTTAGSISEAGLYAAPANAGTYTVTAQTSAATVPSTVVAKATVTVAAAGTCPALPAAGTWDAASVSPVTPPAGEPSYQWNGKPMAIVVDPFVPTTVWLGTGSNGIFKSTNCGAPGTWTKIDTGANHAVLDAGNVWSMAVDPDPSRQGVIYALVSYGDDGLWKSVNGGVDWTRLQIGNNSALSGAFWNNVSMDESNTLHIAVTSHGTTTVPGYANGVIAESFDGGKTWPNIVNMPAPWGEQGGVFLVPGTISPSGTTSTWLWSTGWGGTGSYVTTDSGNTWPAQYRITASADSAAGENAILPLQKAANGWFYVPAVGSLLKSQDGLNWSEAWTENSSFQRAPTDAVAVTGSTIYAGNATTMYSAPLSADSNWSVMPGPPGLTSTSTDFIGFMAYDKAHGVLYVSTWVSVFRYSVPSSAR